MHLFLALAILSIDHVTIAGSNLDAMRKAFTDATSIAPEYGGRHANHATEMAVVSFPDGGYLELMGIQSDADPKALSAHVWSNFLRSDAGPCAFAIRGLQAAGMDVKPAVQSGRTRPDGVRLEWETSDIGSAVRGTLFPFLIHDVTPRKNRVYPSGKPTTTKFTGVSKVIIAVSNLEEAISQYRRTFKLPAPLRQHDKGVKAELAWFEGTPVVLAQGTGNSSWISRRVQKFGEGPCAIVLGSEVAAVASEVSNWFGKKVYWSDKAKLGWRLGVQN